MKKIVICILLLLLLASTGYLIYMAQVKQIKYGIQFRFYQFALQHIFTFMMVAYNIYFDSDNPLHTIYWLTVFTSGNLLSFGAAQFYLATKPDSSIDFSDKQLLHKDIGVVSYIHFYYQINIYFGVFTVFSLVMCGLYKFHQQSQRQRVQQIIENLEDNSIKATGDQQPCSICLLQYKKGEQCYLLNCGHIFHKDCLKDWLHQKLSCPLCRSTNLYNGQQLQ